jgi:hypothetical protein
MELILRISLLLSGIINFLPSILAFIPSKFSKSYGIEIENRNIELLLRHRAVLFFIIGGLMIYSSIMKKYYEIAVTVGFISMISFIILYFLMNKSINPELKKVMIIDLFATIILIIGSVTYFIFPNNQM